MLVVQFRPRYQVLLLYLSENLSKGEVVLSNTNTCIISFYNFENLVLYMVNAQSILYEWFMKVSLDLNIFYKC